MLKHRGLTAGMLMAGALVVAGSSAAAASARTLYVATTGNNANPCSQAHPCKTINRAVGKARKGDTVSVAKGTYHEQVLVTKDIHVIGVGHPVNDVRGRDNGFIVQGPGSAGAALSGFVVKNAALEGILINRTSRVTISGNTVRNNDQGVKATNPVGECAPQGQIPGDCGEGLRLLSVTNSHVTGNRVTGNTGGILLTDELGPTAGNVISGNTVSNNVLDCGITVAGHSAKAVDPKTGKPTPKLAGVYNNVITNNTANGNGIKGEGAGILLAAGGPGSGVYGNLVTKNIANGNGLAGITVHSHTPGQDLNGNKIMGNRLDHNGLDTSAEAEFSPADFPPRKGQTVGILVGSGVSKLAGTVISGNTISHSHFGVFTKNVPAVNAKSNTFSHVTVPLKQI